jgi:DNA-binding NtrC family response regulator
MLRSSDLLHYPSIPEHLSKVRFPPLYVAVIDADDRSRKICERIAGELRFNISGAKDVVGARTLLKNQTVNILLVDPYCRGDHGYLFIDEVKQLHPEVEIIAMAPTESAMTTLDAMRVGAIDYLVKPIDPERLTIVLERVRQQFRTAARSRLLREQQLRSRREIGSLVGESRHLEYVRRFVSSVAVSDQPVLIQGESGSGKDLVGRSIHIKSNRASKSFARLDCNSLSPTLQGSELFGHEKHAFRGADVAERGLLTAAEGGTVLLDEITDLTLEMQFSLLIALRQKRVTPVGSKQSRPISVRVIATTSQDLGLMIRKGRFRKDLFLFLGTSNLHIMPLRERSEDIPETMRYVLDRISLRTNISYKVSEEFLTAITQYSWPGNVRELENVIEDACSRCSNGSLSLQNLPFQFQESGAGSHQIPESSIETPDIYRDNTALTMIEVERRMILLALDDAQGDKTHAARRLGIGKTTLYRKLKEYGFDMEKDARSSN